MTLAPEMIPDDGLDALTIDGAIIRIRSVRLDDAAGLTDLHDRAAAETLYRRFLSPGHNPIKAEVKRLTRPDDGRHVALVAVEHGKIVGTASYELLPDQTRAEFAIFVDDQSHDRGIGTLLLEHLTVRARRHGVTDLFGEILPQNGPMLRVARDLGRASRTSWGQGLVEVHLDTNDDGGDAVDERDLAAARNSLRPLFAPESVAVVGAGRAPGGIGHAVLRSIVDGGYTGRLYPINPQADHVAGLPCFPSLAAAPRPLDLAVIAVPAAAVLDAVKDAAAVGVRAVVIVSSGFGETDDAGRERQRAVVRVARSSGMRLVGPNCLGLLNNDPGVRLRAMFADAAPSGGLALASQSGAVGISVLEQATEHDLGIASFVSLGNKADVSGNDLMAYWYDDPAVKVIALYLESLGNPRRFARVARTVARRKPVLAVKSGRTAAGSRAGASHTAAAAAPDATIDALFEQAGVIRCDGLGDLLGTARMLAEQPLPRGRRLAIVGNAGGINVLCADAADANGLELADLSDDLQTQIREAAPGAAATANPIDLGAAATPDAVASAIRAVAPAVDTIVVAFGATLASNAAETLAAIGRAADDVDVPVTVVLLGVPDRPSSLGQRRAPVYALPEDAIRAVGRAVRYARWRATPMGVRPRFDDLDQRGARDCIEAALRHGGWQSSSVATEVLAYYGIRVTPTLVASAETAVETAGEELGYPVVLKTAKTELVHKSDVGGVRTQITDVHALREAYRSICAATGDPHVLVQGQAPSGVELVAGVVHDPLFGSLIMCGLGGVHTELFRDRSLRLLPITDRDATAMWKGLRGAPLLTGYRGTPAADTDAVEDLLLRLGRLAEDLPEIAELDLNPIIVHEDGLSIVDVKMRIAPIRSEPDAALRSLREPR
jgi:acyl-CoA synthetase (NDP forming)/GNAT superfamily N-acetyltransferase